MGLDPENWMSHLQGDIRVIDSYIPGSHDASAYLIGDRDEDLRNATVGAITQCGSYTAQLNAGSRYFDMRCVPHGDDGKIYMKHDNYRFQTLDDVLKQIYKFHLSHPEEFFFLDFDFDNDLALSNKIADIVESILTVPKLAYGHVETTRGGYNTALTWQMLRDKKAPFICLWSLGGSGRYWQAKNSAIYIDLYDNNDKKTPKQIIQYLDSTLAAWVKEYDPTVHYDQDGKPLDNKTGKLVASQLVNTPFASFITNPGNRDWVAFDTFRNWLFAKTPGSNLGIVKLDFINVGYKRQFIEHIIMMNKFSTPPNLPPLTEPIFYQDKIRLRTQDNRYVCQTWEAEAPTLEIATVAIKTPIPLVSDMKRQCRLTLVDTPTEACNFILRDYDFSPVKPLPYSGNLSADTQDAHGNFRMIPVGIQPTGSQALPENTTISANLDLGGLLYWGVSWAAANNQETFAFFDPNNMSNDGQLYNGSRVLVRAMLNATDNNFLKAFDAFKEGTVRLLPVAGDAIADVLRKDPSHQVFWTIGNDPDRVEVPRLLAASPGTLWADSFVIERIPGKGPRDFFGIVAEITGKMASNGASK